MTALYIFAAIGVACVGVATALAILALVLKAVEHISVFQRRRAYREMERAFVADGERLVAPISRDEYSKLRRN